MMRKLRLFVDNFMSRRNPLFFRKDGGLDFGPAVWAAAAFVGLVMFIITGFGITRVDAAAWAWLGAFVSIAAIAGAAAERAYWIAQSKTPGEVARGIAEAPGREGAFLSPLKYRDFDDPDGGRAAHD